MRTLEFGLCCLRYLSLQMQRIQKGKEKKQCPCVVKKTISIEYEANVSRGAPFPVGTFGRGACRRQ